MLLNVFQGCFGVAGSAEGQGCFASEPSLCKCFKGDSVLRAMVKHMHHENTLNVFQGCFGAAGRAEGKGCSASEPSLCTCYKVVSVLRAM